MKHIRLIAGAAVLVAALGGPARADDLVKLTIGQRGNWDTAITELGTKAGIFKKHGLTLEMIYTSGSGETLQPVISGSVDFGLAVGTLGAMAAYSKGAPVRIVGAQATGAADYWYAKNPAIKTLQDIGDKTIAFSSNGSSTQSVVRAFINEFKLTAKPQATGNPATTLTTVMTDQVDVGWAAPPFGLKEIKEGKIRIVARGSDVPSLRGQTVRVLIVNSEALKTKREAIMRFMEAYREAADWMYVDPKAIEMYSVKMKLPVDLLKQSMDEFQPKATLQSDAFADLDGAVRDAVGLKFLDKPLTKEQLTELLQIPPRKK